MSIGAITATSFSAGSFEESSDRTVTSQSPSTSGVNGDMFAGFLLGATTWGEWLSGYAGPASLQSYNGAYVQDDIKLTRKLTVNLGIRWDFEPARTERYNREVFWDRGYNWNIQPDPGWSWSQVEQIIGQTMPEPIRIEPRHSGTCGHDGNLGVPPADNGAHTTLSLRPAFGHGLPITPRL